MASAIAVAGDEISSRRGPPLCPPRPLRREGPQLLRSPGRSLDAPSPPAASPPPCQPRPFCTLPSSTAPTASEPAAAAANDLTLPSQAPAAAAAAASQGSSIPTTVSRCSPEKTRGRHVFEIDGYSMLKGLGVGNFVQSGTFAVGGYDWAIRFYPDGSSDYYDSDYSYSDSDEDDEDNKGYVSVFLALLTKDASVRALYDMRLLNPATTGHLLPPSCSTKMKPKLFEGEDSTWGIGKFRKKSDLEASEDLQDDSLKIQCDVTVILGTPVSQSKPICDIQVPPPRLLDDLQRLLAGGKWTDVKLKVQDEVFHAHKCVLAMRSPVLAAELYGPLGEGENNGQCVTVNDMEPAVFELLLLFIYTDWFSAMEYIEGAEGEELAKDLLVAADRYAMQRMKLICQSILSKRLNVENAADILALADKHQCSQLKDACIRFIISSDRIIDDVVASQGFEHLKIACPAVIAEIWKKLAKSHTGSSTLSI
ncbi:hypothetical protein ACP4OV_026993 [Aristida adscensionis]